MLAASTAVFEQSGFSNSLLAATIKLNFYPAEKSYTKSALASTFINFVELSFFL